MLQDNVSLVIMANPKRLKKIPPRSTRIIYPLLLNDSATSEDSGSNDDFAASEDLPPKDSSVSAVAVTSLALVATMAMTFIFA